MSSFDPKDLDVLARAFDRALDAVATLRRDPEATKIVVMRGIIDAAKRGERDEAKLTASALLAITLYDEGALDAVPRTSPL